MTAAGDDPGWPRASTWLAHGAPWRDGVPLLAVLGAPLSQASISPSGAHETPAALRAALQRFSTFCAIHGTGAGVGQIGADLEDLDAVDLGDLPLHGLDAVEAQESVERAVAGLVRDPPADGRLPRPADLLVLLGGDNSITRPALRALAGDLSRAGLLTLDAHHDVRGFHAGPTNGTPVRGLLEDGLSGRNIVQVGIGAWTNSRHYRRYADDAGISVVTAAQARAEGVGACVERQLQALAGRCDLVYVDLDVDVLDVAFAPGCPGARSGGLAPHELHAAAQAAGRHPAVIAVDVVEVDATADPTGATVDAGAQCLLHAAAGLVLRGRTEAE